MADDVKAGEFSVPSPRYLFWPFLIGSNALHYFGGELRFFPWRFLLSFVVVVFCVVMAKKAGRVGDNATRVFAWFFAFAYSVVILLGILIIVEQTS